MHAPFERRLEEKTLPSTLLLIGPRDRVNPALAKEWAKKIWDDEQLAKIDSGNHPDLHIYLPEAKSDLHAIDSLRMLVQEMALPPYEAEKKIFVVDQAEKMLPSGSNLLLKTLEEPPADTFIFLLTSHPHALLPTIRSRATPFFFQGDGDAPAEQALTSLLELAEAKQYDRLLETLTREHEHLAQIPIEELLNTLLVWGQSRKPALFLWKLCEEARLADQHNVKPRTWLLHLLLKLSSL